MPETINCLFFGKTARLLQLVFKGNGHPTSNLYPIQKFNCATLDKELDEVQAELGVRPFKSSVELLPSGVYAHIYGPKTIKCSSFRLSDAGRNFSNLMLPPLYN